MTVSECRAKLKEALMSNPMFKKQTKSGPLETARLLRKYHLPRDIATEIINELVNAFN